MTTEVQPRAKAITCCGLSPDHLADRAEGGDGLAQMAATFKALSDQTRLRIVRAMAHSRRELCECEIVPLFGLSQPTISYHLKVLREAGIVECEKRGQWIYYRVSPRVLLGIVRDLAEIG